VGVVAVKFISEGSITRKGSAFHLRDVSVCKYR